MDKFSAALTFVQKSEGGYSNHKNDRGGATNYGVTNVTFCEAKRVGIINKDIVRVKDITKEDAAKVFKEMYWKKIHGDNLPRDLAIEMFDMAVLSSPETAVKTLQKILGVTPDGVIGSETLSAIDNYKGNLLDEYYNAREAKYMAIVKHNPSQKVFLNGWLNRLKNMREYIVSLPPIEAEAIKKRPSYNPSPIPKKKQTQKPRTPVPDPYFNQLQKTLNKWERYIRHKIHERWW